MFTQNYIDISIARFWRRAEQNVVDWDGQSRKVQMHYNNNYAEIGFLLNTVATSTSKPTSYESSLGNSYGIRFGTGYTPAQKTDFDLEAPLMTGLTVTKGTANITEETPGKYVAQNAFVVTNTTDAEINIWEAGMYAPVNIMQDANTKRFHYALMERTVLDAPVNLKPGESKLITYKVTFNQTLNVE